MSEPEPFWFCPRCGDCFDLAWRDTCSNCVKRLDLKQKIKMLLVILAEYIPCNQCKVTGYGLCSKCKAVNESMQICYEENRTPK